MSATIDPQDVYGSYANRLLERQTELLEQLLHAPDLSVGAAGADRDVDAWVAGRTRIALSDRRAAGTDAQTINTGKAQKVLDANPSRIGGQIVNYGSNAVLLYLAGFERVGTGGPYPAIWLASAGGAWDLAFGFYQRGPILWTGPVSAIALSGSSTLSVAVT